MLLLSSIVCAKIDEPLHEQSVKNTNVATTPPKIDKGGAAAGCTSFYEYFDTNPMGSRKFYADQAIAPSSNLGTLYGDPAKATNGASGKLWPTESGGSLDVYSTRDHTGNTSGELILKWSNDIVCNGIGIDFTVFENAYFIPNQNGATFIEPGKVSVSQDGTNWVDFPFDYLAADKTASPASANYADWSGLIGLFPTFYNETSHNYVDHQVDPFKQGDRMATYNGDITGIAGGDPFDLDDLPNTTLGNDIKVNGFRYIKITRISKVENPYNLGNNFPVVENSFDDGGSDIDAIYARYLKASP